MMDDRPEQKPTEQPEQTPQQTPEAPMQPAVAVRRRAVRPPRPARRRGCRRTAVTVLLTFVVTVILVVGGIVYLLFRQPERLLEALRVVTPKYYPIALAVQADNEVHVFYRAGSLVPDVERRARRFDLAWRTTAYHGTVADEVPTSPTPVEPFTGAVLFKDTLWLLADGGYRTWSGDAWSEPTAKPEWFRPQACVAGGKLWVFYEDGERVLNVAITADGKTWQQGGLLQKLPPLEDAEEDANRFLAELRARFRIAVVADKPFVFWYDPARQRLCYRFYENTWSQPQSATGTSLFAVAAAGPLLCLFDVPVWRRNEELGYDEAVVTMRTFDGHKWSDPDNLDIATTLCLDASSVGDDVWLFTSGYKSLFYTVYSDGNWGPTIKLPKPESSPAPPIEQEKESP